MRLDPHPTKDHYAQVCETRDGDGVVVCAFADTPEIDASRCAVVWP
jgi:hypothetical protein